MHPIMILVIVGIALWGVSWVQRQPKAKRTQSILILVGVLMVLLAMTGKLNPLIAAVAAAAAGGARIFSMLQTFSGLQGMGQRFKTATQGQAPNQSSSVNTEWLAMQLDHDSGSMRGRVRRGAFKGQLLSALDEAQLFALRDEVAGHDPRSLQLLEAWLDREHQADWRARASVLGDDVAGGRERDTAMSEAEAREVLGVASDADEKSIVAAHRRLMQKLHPDRGGSDFLAAKINQARDLLVPPRA